MRKLLIIAPVILLLSCIFVTPVFAGDPPPPDTNVGIVIVTPGDTNVDIDVNSGGNTNVTVDGTNMQQVAATAQAALDRWAGCNFMWDYTYYWKITGIGPMVEGRLGNLEQSANATNNNMLIAVMAISKLIQSDNLTAQQVTFLYQQLADLTSQQSTINNKLADRDDVIWNQLMNGAEAHLAVLQALVEKNQVMNDGQVKDLQSQIDTLAQHTKVLTNQLADDTYLLTERFKVAVMVGGGVLLALIITVIILSVQMAKVKRLV